MKNRTTLFNANHLALMHGLSINPTPARLADAEDDWGTSRRQENVRRRNGRFHWPLFLLPLITKLY
ncbi:MAG: hypothetical protein KJ069_24595 [Anaerolineae bacterium]|nr:hypothetical protein [Anaerolineae bacterium]